MERGRWLLVELGEISEENKKMDIVDPDGKPLTVDYLIACGVREGEEFPVRYENGKAYYYCKHRPKSGKPEIWEPRNKKEK